MGRDKLGARPGFYLGPIVALGTLESTSEIEMAFVIV